MPGRSDERRPRGIKNKKLVAVIPQRFNKPLTKNAVLRRLTFGELDIVSKQLLKWYETDQSEYINKACYEPPINWA